MPASNPILTVAQMRAAEDRLIDRGSSVEALMDLAGHGAADWVWRVTGPHRVTVLCGPGNNGGDGYVIAQALRERGGDVVVIAAHEPKTAAARNARGLFAGEVLGPDAEASGEVFVDCLFGSGLTRPLSGDDQGLITRLVAAHRHAIAVDLPSGVDSDSGASLTHDLPDYDLTLALGAWKFAHVLMPSAARMGALRRVDIGIEAVADAAQLLVRPVLHAPGADSHKYRRGLVQVMGGAMPGAASLSAEAALRGGAGYVRLSAPQSASTSHAIVQSREPAFDQARAVLVGPGLGRDAAAAAALDAALSSGVPTVADADALWLLAQNGFGHGHGHGHGHGPGHRLGARPAPAIVTPHAGEFARLYGEGPGSKADRARAAAGQGGSVVVFKGADTVIAAPDGRMVVAPLASSWLSTAGTGDVLAGLCAARLAVTGDPFLAACEAVWLHGEAARRAGAAFAADDLVSHLSPALESCL